MTSKMTRRLAGIVLAALWLTSGAATSAAQTPGLVAETRQAIAKRDFAGADQRLADFRTTHGVTSEWLAALSWMGRAALADKRLDDAERYAAETYRLAMPLVAKGTIDRDADLPIAVGAAIEVTAQAQAQRGARTDALRYLQDEMRKYRGSSIEKRVQKNINLLSLVGTRAPALDLSEYLGPAPPSLDSLEGKVVLLFFWAHWCSDCKTQGPVLAELSARFGSKGLVVFAPTQRYGYVARGVDAPPDVEARYIDQVRQQSYPVLKGQPLPLSEANHRRYGVSSTPTLVLVDRAGIVRLYNPGKMTLEALEPLVRSLLEQAGN